MANNNAIWIVLAIILIIVVVPKLNVGNFAVGDTYAEDSNDIIYQTFREGSQCASNFYQSSTLYGKLYISDVTAVVTHVGGNWRWNVEPEYCTANSPYFYAGASIPGTPYAACPPYSDSSTASNSPTSGTLSDALGTYCKTIQQYCIDQNLPSYQAGESAFFDPNTANGIDEIKCNAYCKPSLGTCVMRSDGRYEAQVCTPDGASISHKICLDTCNEGQCTGSEAVYIDIPGLTGLTKGEDVNARPVLKFHEAPKSGQLLTGVIYQNQQQISGPVYGYTNSQGEALLQFKNVQALKGYAQLVVSATVEGITGDQNLDIYFSDAAPVVMDIPSTSETYFYGDSITLPVRLYLGATPLAGIVMIGEIYSDNNLIASDMSTTNSNGTVVFNFYNVQTTGNAELRVTAKNIAGQDKTSISKLTFSGSVLQFKSTTSSYTQPNTQPIKFNVNIQDNLHRAIADSQVNNLTVMASLSNGKITGSSYKYLGSGDYEINVNVNGTGVFLGKLSLLYSGELFVSSTIQIDVSTSSIGVDVSKIPAAATLNSTTNIPFTFTDSTGNLVDPDSITVIISLPSGYQQENLTKSALTRTGVGSYNFNYEFKQVEKHTFDIYGEKSGLSTGRATAGVAVSSSGSNYGPGPGLNFASAQWYLAGIAIVIAVVYLVRRKK